MAEEQQQLATLHRQRGQLKRRITDFQTYLNEVKAAMPDLKQVNLETIKQLESRIEKAHSSVNQIEEIQGRIYALSIASDADVEYMSDFEKEYFKVVAEASAILQATNNENQDLASSASTRSRSSTRSGERSVHNTHSNSATLKTVKLPTIQLPKFNGQYVKWLEFHDTFSSLIHENDSLSDVQKFHYLRASLKNDAADIIKSLQISASNYAIAWKCLCERYTNKKLLIQNHLSELFHLAEVNRESAIHLREVVDTVTKNLRSLAALGQSIESWDLIIIHLITGKLDKQTARDWESHKLNAELPTLKELTTFLSSKANMLDNLNRGHIEKKSHHETKHKTNKSFFSATYSCYFCKGNHGIYSCEKFLELAVHERIENVKRLKLCINCLKPNHTIKNCELRSSTCRHCKQNHNTLLHINKSEQSQVQTPSSPQVTLSSQVSDTFSQVLLATAVVKVKNSSGQWQHCRALLDSASQSNFITTNMHSTLGIGKSSVNISIQGINKVVAPIKSQCKVELKSCVKSFHTELQCLIIDKISDSLPTTVICSSEFTLPSNLSLADPSFDLPNTVDLLIGAQLFWSLTNQGQIKLGKNLPILQNTHLGWIISGPMPVNSIQSSQCFLTKTLDIQQQMQKFWELEECPSAKPLSLEEQQCEAYFLKTVRRDDIGRYIVSIPFTQATDTLGESRSIALKRLYAVEKRLNCNPIFRQAYLNFMNEYKSLGHMTKLQNPNDDRPHFYLPHHGVINEASKTTRLRVVFDGSCATTSGISLNDLQSTGHTFQSSLFAILIRFRQHFVALSADIQKMYRQVLVVPEERRFQRILWRDNPSLPVDTYELNTVTYGTAAAPYLATRCLMHIADENSAEYPNAAEIIRSDFYVDDVLTGAKTTEEVITICKQITDILNKAQFKLHKWVSNDFQVLKTFDNSEPNSKAICIGSGVMTKTLGLYWLPSSDTLNYKITDTQISETITKRQILSSISQVFDPLGLLSPCTIIGKTIMQLLWQEGLSWDDSVPVHIQKRWVKFRTELPILNELAIPRHIFCKNPSKIELHGFSDASEIAYCACVYAKSINKDGEVCVNLICSKTKVAPLKSITIARLELCAAHLLSNLVKDVKLFLKMAIDHTYLWSDSTIVLGWINTSPSNLKVFVSHRIADIQSNFEGTTWLHVPTTDNPADLGSRGVFPDQLTNSVLWWKGPHWLTYGDVHWPDQPSHTQFKNLPETKIIETSCVSSLVQPLIQFSRFSNYNRLLRAIAYMLRFISNCRKHLNNRITSTLTNEELEQALTYIIKAVQKETFPAELKCLQLKFELPAQSRIISFKPFLDTHGIIRIGGRLQASNLTFDQKHPIVLTNHVFTRLISRHEHIRLSHAGPQLLLASLRDKYWILNGKNCAKAIVHKCVQCFRCSPQNSIPQMGNMPTDRVNQALPFQIVGVDYAGPLNIKDKQGRGCKTVKCYVALFICMVTKAIHIELVSSLSTEAFLASLRRFISRRGRPTKMYSDNGSNFVGANNELNELTELLNDLALEGITWVFIPPNSPHFGGLWEAGVKSLKHHLKRVAGDSLLTFEQVYTLLTQIESVLNSRPLTQMSSEPTDLEPITPSHFLIGRKLTALPEHNLTQIQENRLSCHERVQKLMQHFWSRWSSEYLHSLQQRKKWILNSSNIRIGTMVLLKNDLAPPLSWPVGRITKLFPGQDGIIRVVEVRTTKGTYKRAVAKVFPLPLDNMCSESETQDN